MARLAFFTVSMVASASVFLVTAAPFTISDATMLQNGQAAQTLNAQFLSLSANSTCSVGQSACINGAFATCTTTDSTSTTTPNATVDATNTTPTSTTGTWDIESCASGQQCFALPFVRSDGTYVSCVTPADAMTIISATGVTGGLIATSLPSNSSALSLPLSNVTDVASTSSNSTTASSNSTTTVDNSDNGTLTTTITITLPASGATSLPAMTTTLDASEASSLLASLTAAGASVVTVISGSATGAASTSVATSASLSAGASGSVVTAAPSASHFLSSVSSSIIELTSVSVTATASALSV